MIRQLFLWSPVPRLLCSLPPFPCILQRLLEFNGENTAFLTSPHGGLGLDLARDSATTAALRNALPELADQPIAALQGKQLDADFLNTSAQNLHGPALTALLSFPSYLLLFGLILATAFESLHAVMLDLLRQRPIQSPEYQEMLRWASTREGFLSVTMIGVFTILIILLALATAAGALEGSRKEN